MLKLLEDALQSPAGSFAFIFAILCICFFVVWKLSHFTTKFGTVEKTEKNIDALKEDIHYIRASIKLITDLNNPFAQRQSPVSLTTKGKEVSDEINAESMVLNHWDIIHSELNAVLSKNCNAYDIQIESFKIGDKYQSLLNTDELQTIKNHAFKSGFTLSNYNLLFGIIIRDRFLTSKGLKSSDVDLHDPQKPND